MEYVIQYKNIHGDWQQVAGPFYDRETAISGLQDLDKLEGYEYRIWPT